MNIILIIGFLVLFGAVPPLRWGLRLAALLVIAFMFAVLLTPTPHDPDWGFDLLRAAVLWTFIAVFAGIALRAFFEAGLFGPMRPAGEDLPFLAAFDTVLLFAFGAWLGCIIFRAFALLLQGNDSGLAVHAPLAGAAAAFAVASVALLRNRWAAPWVGAGLTVAALVWDSGWRYPGILIAQANRMWQGDPRCLMIGPDMHSPTSRNDLMALTLIKTDKTPSAVMLLVQGDGGLRLFRWSFRGRGFVTLSHDAKDPRLCTPGQSVLRID